MGTGGESVVMGARVEVGEEAGHDQHANQQERLVVKRLVQQSPSLRVTGGPAQARHQHHPIPPGQPNNSHHNCDFEQQGASVSALRERVRV